DRDVLAKPCGPVAQGLGLVAGKAVLEWVEARQGTPVLALLSGGASSVCEAFAGDEAEALRDWAAWLGEDIPIEEMNRRRAARSRIKGGRLGRLLAERAPAQAWLLADTAPATAAATVGSAPFFVPERPEAVPHRVLASNEDAVTAAALRLAAQGHQAYRHARRVSGSLEDELEAFLRAAAGLSGDTVALVAGGEPTLRVPQGSPPGGRCQHAAALAPRLLQELRLPGVFLAAATDGRDGATDAAGAWTTAADARLPAAARQLRSHEALDGAGRLVRTGATGTNVNEVWVYLGRPAA
ncbi:MAG TPA: MOFRL family protein, partial [Candidatus Thermoplasmatota archaeon]|nr:MOFRL family protein [Candidatus Thermoplasmatota archaeon]